MSDDRKRYLRALFHQHEYVSVGARAQDTEVTQLPAAIEAIDTNLISANPLDGERDRNPTKDYHSVTRPRRADANVVAFRNFVMEFDRGELPEQAEILKSRDVPYTTLTYSGGKSLHAVIALSESLASEVEYRAMFNILRDILWTTDESCVNPSRFTRIGGAFRFDKSCEQKLLDLRRPISLFELKRWLSRFDSHLKQKQAWRNESAEKHAERLQQLKEDGITGLAALDERDQKFLEGEWDGSFSRHKRLVAIAYRCLEHAVDYDECLARITDAHLLLGMPERAHEAQGIVNHVYLGGKSK